MTQRGHFAAAKIIPVEYEEELEDFVVEVDILSQIRHPGVIGLEGSYLIESKLWVVMELCEGGALDDILIELEKGFEEKQIRALGHQLLQGKPGSFPALRVSTAKSASSWSML